MLLQWVRVSWRASYRDALPVGGRKQGGADFAWLLAGAVAVFVEVARFGALLFVVDRNAIDRFALGVGPLHVYRYGLAVG